MEALQAIKALLTLKEGDPIAYLKNKLEKKKKIRLLSQESREHKEYMYFEILKLDILIKRFGNRTDQNYHTA